MSHGQIKCFLYRKGRERYIRAGNTSRQKDQILLLDSCQTGCLSCITKVEEAPMNILQYQVSLNVHSKARVFKYIIMEILFKASALWADAFIESLCVSVCGFVCPLFMLSFFRPLIGPQVT